MEIIPKLCKRKEGDFLCFDAFYQPCPYLWRGICTCLVLAHIGIVDYTGVLYVVLDIRIWHDIKLRSKRDGRQDDIGYVLVHHDAMMPYRQIYHMRKIVAPARMIPAPSSQIHQHHSRVEVSSITEPIYRMLRHLRPEFRVFKHYGR